MASGEIVYARFPIDLDVDADPDTAITKAFAGSAIFPIATYDVIHTELVLPTGTKTKGMVVIIAQSIT